MDLRSLAGTCSTMELVGMWDQTIYEEWLDQDYPKDKDGKSPKGAPTSWTYTQQEADKGMPHLLGRLTILMRNLINRAKNRNCSVIGCVHPSQKLMLAWLEQQRGQKNCPKLLYTYYNYSGIEIQVWCFYVPKATSAKED